MCWRRMEKISWNDRVKNDVLRRFKEEINILRTGLFTYPEQELPSETCY